MGRIGKKLKAKRFKQALIDITNNKIINRKDDVVENNKGYRMFVIGAGFSVPAGLPMASELFSEVRSRIEMNYGLDTRFHRSLREYIDYRKKCDGVDLAPEDVDLEEFMSYLDIEHFLGLKGSDTFSEHGNEAQLFVKRYIGQVIHERTPKQDELPVEYYEFAEQLSVNDIVITRKSIPNMLKVDAKIDGKLINSYYGDGIIISTPTGSTAYNLSVGGPLVYPLTSAFIVTPIAPHSLTQRPLVLPADFVIEFTITDNQGAVVIVDGQDIYEVSQNDSIKIQIASKKAKLIHRCQRNYFEVLNEKLNWGN